MSAEVCVGCDLRADHWKWNANEWRVSGFLSSYDFQTVVSELNVSKVTSSEDVENWEFERSGSTGSDARSKAQELLKQVGKIWSQSEAKSREYVECTCELALKAREETEASVLAATDRRAFGRVRSCGKLWHGEINFALVHHPDAKAENGYNRLCVNSTTAKGLTDFDLLGGVIVGMPVIGHFDPKSQWATSVLGADRTTA
ncbi:hypothetical protein BGZ65_006935 [Modicella reniformis]|uniref:Uncharacterized protein n=1 Tax=Modicella reniformis TaxID=1440133 RepID=A0A9P6JMU3_9FUNG|nr:hypothetical protein BGZ65_006935 [Modicella reniformis]